jgi:SHS2 domain-containing protein
MTRAGLLESALKGTFAIYGAAAKGEAEEVTRPFVLHGADFDGLLAAFLDKALALAAENGETYQAVKFDLITVMDAEGAFVGKPCGKPDDAIKKMKRGVKAERNAEGAWEAEITFER